VIKQQLSASSDEGLTAFEALKDAFPLRRRLPASLTCMTDTVYRTELDSIVWGLDSLVSS